MSKSQAPRSPAARYDEIEATLAQTSQGRCFLDEFKRRSRAEDTQLLLSAVAGLENRVCAVKTLSAADRLRQLLAEMTAAIRRAKVEIAELSTRAADPTCPSEASDALDGVLRGTERASSDILDATEQIQETAWTMREGGFDAALCDVLDQRVTEIYAACAAQDLTFRGIDRVVRSVAFIDDRISALNRVMGSDARNVGLRPPLDPH